MTATVYLVTGGARSGKSSYAERLCEKLCKNPIYLATASNDWNDSPANDGGDFAERIKRHQQDREGRNWTTIEEPVHPSIHSNEFLNRAVLVDCATLWLTNHMLKEGAFEIDSKKDSTQENGSSKDVTEAVDRALTNIKAEFDKLIQPYNVTFVVVTNEVGSGPHASNHLGRKFVDAQGWFNQYVATKAKWVVHLVCGVPNVIKAEEESYHNNNKNSRLKQLEDEATMLDKFLSGRKLKMDEKGYFLISVDTTENVIVASFHSCIKNDKGEICDLDGKKITCHGKGPEAAKVWRCRTAKEITVEIFERWPPAAEVLSVGHAAYIGREVQKAEYCLLSGKTYRQN